MADYSARPVSGHDGTLADPAAIEPITLKRILLAIPGRLMRESIGLSLQRPDRLVQDQWESLSQLRETCAARPAPDLIIVRVSAEDGVLSTICDMRRIWPAARWILLGRAFEPGFVRKAAANGIDTFLVEDSPLEVLGLLTDLTLLGHSLLPAELTKSLTHDRPASCGGGEAARVVAAAAVGSAERAAEPSPIPPAPAERRPVTLSERELQILRCVSEGLSNKMIARHLTIAEATVKAHVKALLRKMQVANRTQAAISAPRYLGMPDRRLASLPASPSTPPDTRLRPVVAEVVQLRSAAG